MRPAIERIWAAVALPVRRALPAMLASVLVGGFSGVVFFVMISSSSWAATFNAQRVGAARRRRRRCFQPKRFSLIEINPLGVELGCERHSVNPLLWVALAFAVLRGSRRLAGPLMANVV
jgi:hypothetical protein